MRLFGLVSVRVTWLGGLGAVYAVCKFGWLFTFSVGSICFSGWLAMLLAYFQMDKTWFYLFMLIIPIMCVVTLFSGVLMWAFSGTKAWKDNKKELYRLAKESIRDKWCEG